MKKNILLSVLLVGLFGVIGCANNPDESKAVNDFASGLSTSINETVNDYVNNNVHKHFKGENRYYADFRTSKNCK